MPCCPNQQDHTDNITCHSLHRLHTTAASLGVLVTHNCKPALTTVCQSQEPNTDTELVLRSHEQRLLAAACASRLVCVWRSSRCWCAAVLSQQDSSEQVMLSAVLSTHLQAADSTPQQQVRGGRAEETTSVMCWGVQHNLLHKQRSNHSTTAGAASAVVCGRKRSCDAGHSTVCARVSPSCLPQVRAK